jgi:hypothetical protein
VLQCCRGHLEPEPGGVLDGAEGGALVEGALPECELLAVARAAAVRHTPQPLT